LQESGLRIWLLTLRNGVGGAVARGTVLGRRLIKEDRLGGHHFRQFVALGAMYVLMRSPERKVSPLLMVERRRLPLAAVVAVCAGRDICLRKLLAMDVLMAILALRRCNLEIHMEQIGFKVRRLVAIHAGGGSMRSQQREFRFRVVEARHLLPRLGGVTGLAARH